MKQIVVISGKGGTGKTTLTSSIAYLTHNRNIADCDVEAPNLNLILDNEIIDKKIYIGGKVPKIDIDKCIRCNLCRETCRFGAINEKYEINPYKCEGCGACEYICPENAIVMEDDNTGLLYKSKIAGGMFSHAELSIGADGAGKVVTEVRKAAVENGEGKDFVLIDGSPGIGCVVIASMTGCDLAIAVTEPTQSGISDLKRVLSLANFFNMKAYVVVNKYDLNIEKTDEIEEYCRKNGFTVIGRIPFDPFVNTAIKENKPVVLYEESAAGKAIKEIWSNIKNEIGGEF